MKLPFDKYRFQNNLRIAVDAIIANGSRSLLTALGIVFGVAAVISMMAIGRGAKEEVLEQIKLIGVNNIVITPVVEQEEEDIDGADETEEKSKKFSKGLDLQDVLALQQILPNIAASSPEIEVQTTAIYKDYSRSVRIIGINNSYFTLANIGLAAGSMFSEEQIATGKAVCIIGSDIRAKFFKGKNPVGKFLKVGEEWLQVIGVTERKVLTEKTMSSLGIRNYNLDIYTPLQTILLRYKDRAKLVAAGSSIFRMGNSVMIMDDEDEEQSSGPLNYHQLDRLTVQVADAETLLLTAEVIERTLKRLHNNVVDFEINIPVKLLEQQQRTKDIFNLVLSIIAGISLLVGGIGIMNIMLASVLERTREIGTRRALGATQVDIISQFLSEAILISLSGGILGILLGVGGAIVISRVSGILTIITPLSVFVAFGVAFATGLFFGYRPARKAALQNPIESLRYE
jgi:putative ABC transport system permease protein